MAWLWPQVRAGSLEPWPSETRVPTHVNAIFSIISGDMAETMCFQRPKKTPMKTIAPKHVGFDRLIKKYFIGLQELLNMFLISINTTHLVIRKRVHTFTVVIHFSPYSVNLTNTYASIRTFQKTTSVYSCLCCKESGICRWVLAGIYNLGFDET